MKFLYTTILALTISAGAFSQDFKISAQSADIYEVSVYPSATRAGVFTSDGYLIHCSDGFEVLDLNKGTTAIKHDFEGGTGQTWIDQQGRYVGNYSQNVIKTDKRWVDAMQVYDIRAGKIYTNQLKDGYWNKGVFHPKEAQVLVNDYNAVEGTARILLYDFVNQKEIKTFFSTSKFSTVIMAMAFSQDGSKIYAGIAPNGYTSYINVYDTKTGDVIKKISFKYNLDKIFVADDYFFCSGVDGDTGDSFTSRISTSTYEVKTWDNFRMENLHPSGKFCYAVEYKSNMLSHYDLTTGAKSDLFDVSKLGDFDYAYASGFSTDGKYFFLGRLRKKDAPDYSKALVVFKNELMEQDVHIFEPVEDVIIEPLPTSYNYTRTSPKFSIDFEAEPEVTEEKTSSGGLKLTLKHSPSKNLVYMVMVSEMSSKIKPSKYAKTSVDMADKFVNKLEATDVKKASLTIDDQSAADYTFNKKGVFYRYVSVCFDGYAYQIIYLNSAGDGVTGEDFINSFTTK